MSEKLEIAVRKIENSFTVILSPYTGRERVWAFEKPDIAGSAVELLLTGKDPATGEPFA